ncbi:hypothetical protein [Laribacter hongkongensis]|uniref:hypothetical protein n=1 Tax=Laribacter hongkongensis TaxID=168471 RepID=UPI001EFD9B77|nr:hypothetical protein [Laribacter hongkongensis]MCG9078093.1 hypothetical protein [Laribacter hongkongensis]
MEREDIHRHYSWQFKAGRVVDNSVPDSWLSAISSLCANVDALLQGELRESFHWLDIKEKHGMLSVSYAAPGTLTDAIDALVDAADTACRQAVRASAPATGILLRQVDSLNWSGQAVAAWLPVDELGKPLSGAIIYIEDMPPTLQAHFMTWLEQQPLSISRPPLGLPRRGQAYFTEDVLTSMDSAPH